MQTFIFANSNKRTICDMVNSIFFFVSEICHSRFSKICHSRFSIVVLFTPLFASDGNRGSYMSAHVLLNLLNELGKRDKMRGLPSILSLFRNEFNKFNKTRARMLDSIYNMTLRIL